MKDVLREKLEFYSSEFRTKEGLFDFFIGNLIWGFLIVAYTTQAYNYIYGILSFMDGGFIRQYLAYLIFGLASSILGVLITYLIIKIFKLFFKDGKII